MRGQRIFAKGKNYYNLTLMNYEINTLVNNKVISTKKRDALISMEYASTTLEAYF